MNDTPTPRTDALMPDQGHKRTIYEHIQVMEAHARQLERELAEAKAELKKYTTDSGDDSLYNVRRLRKELTDITKQRDALADALKRIMKLTTPDQNMPYCKDDRIHGIAGGALAATKKGKP